MLSLVTDRTEEDCLRLQRILATKKELRTPEEQAELDSHKSKGAYNYTDMNRVIAAVEYLGKLFESLGYTVAYSPITTPSGGTTWAVNDIIFVEPAKQYISNIGNVKELLKLQDSVPELPNTLLSLTPSNANDIEEILLSIEMSLTYMTRIFERANVPWITSGSPNFYFPELLFNVCTSDKRCVVTSDGYSVCCE